MEERALVEASGNGVNLFAFTSIDRAWKFATLLSESAIIPDTFRNNPASCLIALDMANRMHRNPMEVMQAMYIVHGKPWFSSSFLISLINSCGLFERLKFEYVGDPGKETRGCRAWTIEKKTGEKLVGPLITLKMSKEERWSSNNKKWESMPDVMLSYRAASFFSRAYCPDLTGGFHSSDELSDSQDDFKADIAASLTDEVETESSEDEEREETSLEALKEEILE
ncbi:MAG: hypothetical protein IJ587_01365 [Synergistaceae bacterium]|nr:hypothetical protein [Synergistaceae bacterium]